MRVATQASSFHSRAQVLFFPRRRDSPFEQLYFALYIKKFPTKRQTPRKGARLEPYPPQGLPLAEEIKLECLDTFEHPTQPRAPAILANPPYVNLSFGILCTQPIRLILLRVCVSACLRVAHRTLISRLFKQSPFASCDVRKNVFRLDFFRASGSITRGWSSRSN